MSNQEKLSDSDRRMIKYFITEKGDITRWCDWPEKKTLVAKIYPELIDALDRLKIAERTLKAVVEKIAQEGDDEEKSS